MEKISWFSTPIEKGPVSRLVLERIKKAIIEKELKPGDYLPSEIELAHGFGVGKSSVREAVKMLEAMGVVEIKRGQGMMISNSSVENTVGILSFQLLIQQGTAEDIVDLRTMFEQSYTVMAIDKATDEDIESMERTISQLAENIAQGTQTLADDILFHQAILHATHNPYVELIGNTIMQLFYNSIQKSVLQTPELVLSDHNKILSAFKNKNYVEVKEHIASSLARWEPNISK